jgi:exodeoxyribonuclease VII large subunit
VQGENAKESIVSNIEKAQEYDLDVLIVGRGGGSIEDLWPFNEEIVARAIFKSKIPVISAVGHEIDFTIADFVADMRAATPTAAAELAVPNIIDLFNKFKQYQIRINENINKKINYFNLYLDSIKNSYVIKNPLLIYDAKFEKLDILSEKINKEINYKLEKINTQLDKYKTNNLIVNPMKIFEKFDLSLSNNISKLELLNPLGVLNRGYSVTYKDNKVVKSIKDIKKNDKLNIKLVNGTIETIVDSIKEDK